ncbi:hypothetical protein FXO38_33968 [Capsicum annuum]|uniref:CCHC-type domain-containing protein n=1 Tax=Capsicum annuum TaxID=4072 RepID=A0A2G2Z8X0_CAPAN|nr:hypothetical protein FXO38_33968 [Capsicum annuum]KAF3662319.1 hypothetical protein FXO37_12508 [Capsicum annuum]PHT78446.1 hypothetical protein T459_16498 [Capsicum annuum]
MTNESQMQDAATTVGAISIASTSRANAPQPMAPAEKLEKFAGIDFKRWKQKSSFTSPLYAFKENKATERRSKGNFTINGAHLVEDDQNNSKKKKKVEQENNKPKKKFKGKCFNYGKIGHKFMDCRAPKKVKKKDHANMVESNKKSDDLCAMFSEYNLVGNPREW